MKRISKVLLCAALTGAMAVSAAGAADLGSLTPQGAKAYLDQITALQTKYGQATTYTENGHEGLLSGLCMAKLIDLDNDGIPELYCGAGRKGGQFMYTYESGTLKQLAIPSAVTNFDTEYSPCALFYIGKDKSYLLVDEESIDNGTMNNFLTKQGDKIVTAFSYGFTYPDSGNGIAIMQPWLNGKMATDEEASTAYSNFTDGLDLEYYYYSDTDYDGFLTYSPLLSLDDTITSLRTLANTQSTANAQSTAKVSTHKVSLNGKSVNLGAYTINGSNYFKLRDLAKALDGLNTGFEVYWNATEKRIDLISNAAYTPVGGEQAALPAGNKVASLTNASVYLDGQPLNLTAYSIGGNNYFKLRDLGDALGFDVDWDANTMTMILNVK